MTIQEKRDYLNSPDTYKYMQSIFQRKFSLRGEHRHAKQIKQVSLFYQHALLEEDHSTIHGPNPPTPAFLFIKTHSLNHTHLYTLQHKNRLHKLTLASPTYSLKSVKRFTLTLRLTVVGGSGSKKDIWFKRMRLLGTLESGWPSCPSDLRLRSLLSYHLFSACKTPDAEKRLTRRK